MADQSLAEILKNISGEVKSLVRSEVALAKSELVPSAKNAGVGAGMLGGAGYFALNGMTLLYVAASLGIWKLGVPIALAFVIVGVVLLIIAGVLALIGRSALKKVHPPEQTVAQAQESVAAVKGAISRATAAAKTPQIEGEVLSRRELR